MMKTTEHHKQIKKPIVPPTRVFKSIRDYAQVKSVAIDYDYEEEPLVDAIDCQIIMEKDDEDG